MRKLCLMGISAALLVIGGCANFTPRQVAEPSGVTLKAAVEEVVESIALLKEVPERDRAGLLLDEVTVTFNIAASANASQSGQLKLDAALPSGVSAGATASAELTNAANRGNQIVMKFKHIATADLTKGAYASSVGKPVSGSVAAKPASPNVPQIPGASGTPAAAAKPDPCNPKTIEDAVILGKPVEC